MFLCRQTSTVVFLLLFTSLLAAAEPAVKSLDMDYQREAVSLNGPWDILLDHPDKELWKPGAAANIPGWQEFNVPGSFFIKKERDRKYLEKLQCVWTRRKFSVSSSQVNRNAVLKWNGVRFGATAWINGQEVASSIRIGPHTALLPEGILKTGENDIVIKVTGWAGVPRGKEGYPLFPAGMATQSPWGSIRPGIIDDLWIEFYDGLYLESILAMPDVDKKKVTFRIYTDTLGKAPQRFRVKYELTGPTGSEPISDQVLLAVPLKGRFVELTVPVENPILWSPDNPKLYTAKFRALGPDDKLLDEVSFTFGMRELEIIEGNYILNGKPLWLRGSTLVNEWLWQDSPIRENVKRYIVDEARMMSLNIFRTHGQPAPTSWLNMGDRHGTMFIQELPVLMNYDRPNFTPEEADIYRKNALIDAEAWIKKNWNHPCVVIWALSNESAHDSKWEQTVYYSFTRKLDPTRSSMRTDKSVEMTRDIHTCSNFTKGPEGHALENMEQYFRRVRNKNPHRTLGNTEYMNVFRGTKEHSLRWLGKEGNGWGPDYSRVYSEFMMEHTEAMRRMEYDLILPYMYAGWSGLRRDNNWRGDFPTQPAAVLHSAMSPVLASLDLFDRNFNAGTKQTTPIHLINETHKDADAELLLYVTPEHPQFVPTIESEQAAVWKKSYKITLKANSVEKVDYAWQVPQDEGNYYLGAVLKRPGQKPVISQRTIRAVKVQRPADLYDRKIPVLGIDPDLKHWGWANNARWTVFDGGQIDSNVLVICDGNSITDKQKALAPEIRKFAEQGGRVVILRQLEWDWTQLADYNLDEKELPVPNKSTHRVRASRLFAYEGAQDHPMLDGIEREFLMRWNGGKGTIAERPIQGAALEKGKKLLWGDRPDLVYAVSLPVGRGEIIICQLQLRKHANPNLETYDPVADKIMMNLLAR